MKKIVLLIFIIVTAVFLTACDLLGLKNEKDNEIYVSFNTYGAGDIPEILLKDFIEFPELDEKEGYNFGGWYFDRKFNEEASLENVYLKTESFTLYARWDQEIIYHEVTFIDAEGKILKKVNVADNSSVIPPLPPTKIGYTFLVWDKDLNQITESVIIQAVYIIKLFTVTFVDFDGKVLKTETLEYLSPITPPDIPIRENRVFVSWDLDFSLITEDIVITAVYEVETITITYNTNGGDSLEQATVSYGEDIPLPTPTKEGYVFLGWTYNGGPLPEDKAYSDMTLVASWGTKIITIIYDTNGGNALAHATVSYGGNIPLPTPTKEGYVFLGWTYNGSPLPTNKAYYEMTLVANWGAKSDYTISFDTKGGAKINDITVNNYDVIKSLPKPTKTGSEFLHWIYDGYIVNTPTVFTFQKDVTFEAVYTTTYLSTGSEVIYRNKSNKVMIPDTYGQKEEEFRGVWVSFIVNDLSSYQNEIQMKNQLLAILNNLVAWNMNAIVFHVRTHNNAYFNTDRDPIASYVRNVNFEQWDYLEWLIEECHKRNIEFHAWLNPYRLPSGTNAQTLANSYAAYPNNPASNVNNILVGNSQAILNPGEPVVRDYVIDVCMEIIEKYDVDAIHFDDYFYIEMPSNADLATYNKYKANSSATNISDWRREQVDIFIRDLSIRMRAYNQLNGRNVELGISPSGIWRNGTGSTALTYDQNGTAITNGSNTAGMEHWGGYLFSDTKKWIDEEWIDYIIPQTYWSFTQTVAQYAELADWWSAVVRNKNVKLYMGMGIYMTGYAWGTNPYEASDQVLYNTKHPEIKGVCLFRYGIILQRINQANKGTLRLINEYWLDQVKTPS